ncbi:MAG: O-antigen ligase family protein [Alphaproteobacteria bacterium]
MAALIGTAIVVPLGIVRGIAAMHVEQAFGIVAIVAAITVVLMPAHKRPVNTRAFVIALAIFLGAYVVWPPYVAVTLPFMPFITPARALLMLLLVGWIFTVAPANKIHERLWERLGRAKPLWIAILVIIAFRALAIPGAMYPDIAAKSLLDQCMSLFLPLIVAVSLIESERDVDLIGRVLLVAAIFIGLTVVYEAIAKHNFFVEHLAKLVHYEAHWLDMILTPSVRNDGRFRTQGPFTVPLSLAEFFTLVIPFLFYAFDKAKNPAVRFGLILIAALFEFGIISTDSRTAMVTSVCLYGFYAAFRGVIFLRAHPKAELKPLMMLFVAFIALSIPVVLIAMLDRLGLGHTLGAHGTRGAQLALGIPKILKQPIIGYGSGIAGYVLGYRGDGVHLTIDNYYLQVALDAGVPALLAQFVLQGWLLWVSLGGALRSKDVARARVYLTFFLFFVSFTLVRTTLSQADNLSLSYIMMGVFAAYHAIASKAEKEEMAAASVEAEVSKRRRSRAWRVMRPAST